MRSASAADECKVGRTPGSQPTPTSACCSVLSILEAAGPGGPARTRGSAPPLIPFDNPLGQRIYDNVSLAAWKLWLEQMKMIMNEYRLNLGTTEAQEFLLKQMEDYFFGEGAAFPPGYQPPQAKN